MEKTYNPAGVEARHYAEWEKIGAFGCRLSRGETPPGETTDPAALAGWDWPAELAQVIYIDRFGNAMTGLRAASLPGGAVLIHDEQRVGRARTFSDVPTGTAFWYENANGLVEIAVNQGRADETLDLTVGSAVTIEGPGERPGDQSGN